MYIYIYIYLEQVYMHYCGSYNFNNMIYSYCRVIDTLYIDDYLSGPQHVKTRGCSARVGLLVTSTFTKLVS